MSKRSKWMKGIPSGLINAILEEKPDKVDFLVIEPSSVTCIITRGDETAKGIAICSVMDKKDFDVREGKRKSAVRALRALKVADNIDPIRMDESQFPRRWKPSQVRRVMEYGYAFGYKGIYNNV